jgi:multicomponent Na+:H+ antiporter subunit G
MIDQIIMMAALTLVSIGTLLVVIGAFGLIRLPDVYSRIHAAGVIDTGGAALIILGLCLYSGWNLVTVKLIAIGVFLVFTSPISGHAIALVAHDQKIDPEGVDETRSAKSSKAGK